MSTIYNGKAILESMTRQANEVKGRWSKNIQTVNRVRKESGLGPMSEWTSSVLAQCLETYSKRRALMEAQTNIGARTEATQAGDIGFMRKHGINILTATIPSLIANDITSVQPLQSRIGEIRYLDVRYGTNKGPIKSGDSLFSFDKVGGPAGHFTYSYDEVTDETTVWDSTFKNTTLDFLPVVPGTVKFTKGSDVYTDNGEGKIMKSNSEVGTIDYATGKITLTSGLTDGNDVLATYQYDNITSPIEAPEINLGIKAIPVQARSRKLKTVMSFDALYDLQAQYGYNAEAETSTLVSNALQYEIDGELIEDMYRGASAKSTTFNSRVPNAVSTLDHYEGFIKELNAASNNIFEATRFANGTFAVLGMDAATIVESLANRGFIPSGQTGNGPHFIGTMGNYQLYKTPTLSERDGYFIGYKGDSIFHAGLVYAPYMPIMTTDLLAYENFDVRQGYATAYAKKMVNSNLYSKGKVTNS